MIRKSSLLQKDFGELNLKINLITMSKEITNPTEGVSTETSVNKTEMTFQEEQRLKEELHKERFRGFEDCIISIKGEYEKLQDVKEEYKDFEDMYDYFHNTSEYIEDLHDELNHNKSKMIECSGWIEEYKSLLKEEVMELISGLEEILSEEDIRIQQREVV